MKITPPRSRRRCTQPISSDAFGPHRDARSSPHVCVRRRSPRKSSATEVSISMFSPIGRAFSVRAISSRVSCTCSPDAISFSVYRPAAISLSPTISVIARAQFVGQFQARFSFACRPLPRRCPARRRSRASMAAVPQRRFAQRRDVQIERARPACSLFHAHHQAVFADRKADPGECTFEPSDSASPS